MTGTVDIQELRRLAEAATTGDWFPAKGAGNGEAAVDAANADGAWHICETFDSAGWSANGDEVTGDNNAAYIAAASPSTILALIEVAEAAEVYYTRYARDEASDDGVEMTGCGQQQHEDAKRLRTALEGVKK